jgi:hypothetical protein
MAATVTMETAPWLPVTLKNQRNEGCAGSLTG